MGQKNKRTEHVWINVTKEVKKEFEAIKDDPTAREDIIRRYLRGEVEWLESEMKEIDEATIRYKAKLIGIKDNFAKANKSHLEEIGNIYSDGERTLSKLNIFVKNLDEKIGRVSQRASKLVDQINKIDYRSIEKLIEALEKYESLNQDQKDIIQLFAKEQSKA